MQSSTSSTTSTSSASGSRMLIILAAHVAMLASFPTQSLAYTVFQETGTLQRTAKSKAGVEFELPDFDKLFDGIQEVSPLAKQILGRKSGGFDRVKIEGTEGNLPWKSVEKNKNKKRPVQQIDKLDKFQHNTPLVRFRATVEGPSDAAEHFCLFTMDVNHRAKWDPSIEQVYERYPINDLDVANILMGPKYGDCTRLGIGYCQTKKYMAVPGREQLTICGIQSFPETKSTLIWGTECEDWHNHLLPPGQRYTRAKSHLFSIAVQPTDDNHFDVEYCLQIDIGGNIPTWVTTPIVIETIKKQFKYAQTFYNGNGSDSEIYKYVAETEEKKTQQELWKKRQSILMTP